MTVVEQSYPDGSEQEDPAPSGDQETVVRFEEPPGQLGVGVRVLAGTDTEDVG